MAQLKDYISEDDCPVCAGWGYEYALPEGGWPAQMLRALREMRDRERDQELRHAYNEACDRLDVLVSKLIERESMGQPR